MSEHFCRLQETSKMILTTQQVRGWKPAPHPKLRIVSPYHQVSVSVDSSLAVTRLDSYISGLSTAVRLAVAAAIVIDGIAIALGKLVR